MDDLDLVHRDAQLVGHHLGKGGFVALTMAVRAGKHRHAASRMHPHRADFVQPRAGA